MSNLEKPLFIKALLQGYVYFRDKNDKTKIHKGFIVRYNTGIAYFEQCLEVAYGVHYYFSHLVNGKDELWIDDCDDALIKNPKEHPAYKECYNCGLTTEDYQLDFEHYGIEWALNKEDLETWKNF